ncbi:MAG: hypothetical protein GY781_17350 [Gammaproteobacteria bacterium]|nr:hypothetical protein [Gammaproteobacteria bacterium]
MKFVFIQGFTVVKAVFFNLLIAGLLVSTTSFYAQTIDHESQLEDLRVLKDNLEKYHPGLYRYTTKDSIDLVFQQVEALVRERPIVDFFAEITWLLNKVKCGHTQAALPQSVNDAYKASQRYLPLSVSHLGKRLFVNESFTKEGELMKGEEILSINGKTIPEINALIFPHYPVDGFIHSRNYRITERYFAFLYQLYVDRGTQLYLLKVKGFSGDERVVVVTGQDWDNMVNSQRTPDTSPMLNIEFSDNYTIMKIQSFDRSSTSNADEDYNQFQKNSFINLKKKGVENLILDLRGNMGGEDIYGATLVSYFADKPFRYFERIEVTDTYVGDGRVTKKDGRNLMTSHKGLSVLQPQIDRYIGALYVLIDGWCFSTCADVATVLHHNKWATFIGEETGGGYSGNTSGSSKTLTLPNSNIRINIPMWKYTTANLGHQFHGRGVIPDYPVQQTLDDLINNRDAVMDKVVELIKNPIKPF